MQGHFRNRNSVLSLSPDSPRDAFWNLGQQLKTACTAQLGDVLAWGNQPPLHIKPAWLSKSRKLCMQDSKTLQFITYNNLKSEYRISGNTGWCWWLDACAVGSACVTCWEGCDEVTSYNIGWGETLSATAVTEDLFDFKFKTLLLLPNYFSNPHIHWHEQTWGKGPQFKKAESLGTLLSLQGRDTAPEHPLHQCTYPWGPPVR